MIFSALIWRLLQTGSERNINMNEKMRVNLSELLPIMSEQLESGKEVCFSPNGISMLPVLRPGKDSVTLQSPPEKLKKYDLPLYRRNSGQFVLHRVVKVNKDGTYTMCGDNQYAWEKGIKHSQIIGVVTSFNRDGKEISCKNFKYRLYAFIRVRERWMYGILVRIKRKLSRLAKKEG